MTLSARDVELALDAPERPPPVGAGHASASEVFERVRSRAELVLGPIELHAHRLLTRQPSESEVVDARGAAAALAAGLGQLQLHSLAQLARHIEALLAETLPDAAHGMELAGAIEDIRTMLASAIAQLENSPSLAGTVLAIGEPTSAFDATLWVLSNHGHAIVHTDQQLPEFTTAPDIVVASIGASADPATQTVLRAVSETYAVPVILFHDNASFETQAELAHHCTTLLPARTPPAVASEEIMRLRAAVNAELSATVWGFSAAVPVLEAHGYEVRIASRLDDLTTAPFGAIVVGKTVRPRRMLEITRLIRASTTARRAPVVWQGPLDATQGLTAARLGVNVVDDFDDVTASSITTELRRSAADEDPSTVQPDTVLHWAAARLLIDRALIGAQRSNSPAAVAVVRPGPECTDEERRRIEDLLVREFRRGDVVGTRNERDYVIALQGIGRRVALDRLTSLAPRLDDGVRIGVAEFPSDGRSAEDLVHRANLSVERADLSKGPAVVSTAWRPTEDRAADLLVVDADVVLGEMLASALADRGHHAKVVTDGHETLSFLTSCPADELPKILMLDLDVGGSDGRALLAALGPAGLLPHMKVLVMSSRAAENDIRMAFDLGADEVIRKPFPIVLLLHRIVRLLAS